MVEVTDWHSRECEQVGHEARIAGLEKMVKNHQYRLENIRGDLPEGRQQPGPDSHTEIVRTVYPAPIAEGESSFGCQALHAGQLAEISTSDTSQSPTVIQEMEKLRGMTYENGVSGTQSNDYVFGSNGSDPMLEVDFGSDLPSSTTALQVLKLHKAQPGMLDIIPPQPNKRPYAKSV